MYLTCSNHITSQGEYTLCIRCANDTAVLYAFLMKLTQVSLRRSLQNLSPWTTGSQVTSDKLKTFYTSAVKVAYNNFSFLLFTPGQFIMM